MSTELIIFSAILIVSVILHFLFWLDSKKRYAEYMKRQEDLNKRIEKLEESHGEMDRMLDDAEEAIDRIDKGIEGLRKRRVLNKKKTIFEN